MKVHFFSYKNMVNQQTNELVNLEQGKPQTTSLKIAEVFEKEHRNITRDIENLEIPEDKHRLNFEQIFYKDKYGREQKAYSISKDGFVLLAMGYTGAKAMQFKLNYIDAFNAMESELRKRLDSGDSKYFDQKTELMNTKHALEVEIANLRLELRNTALGKRLTESEEALRKTKTKYENLETKYFKYRHTLFPFLESDNS